MRTFHKSPARIAFAVCAVLAIYFASTAVQGAIRNERLADARDEAAREVGDLHDRKEYLEAIITYVGSDEYVEQEARRQLGFVRPGEVAFVVVSPPIDDEDSTSPLWWERMFPR
jgi:cell division protein FtsB